METAIKIIIGSTKRKTVIERECENTRSRIRRSRMKRKKNTHTQHGKLQR